MTQETLPAINDFAGLALGVFCFQLLAAAVARVHESPFLQAFERGFVEGCSRALDTLGIPPESEPFQVFVNAVDVFGAGASLVVVLDAQVYLKAPFASGRPHIECRKHVAFVQVARGARRKSYFSFHAGKCNKCGGFRGR